MESINREIGWGRSSTGYLFDPKTGNIWERGNTLVHEVRPLSECSNIRIPFQKTCRPVYDRVTGRYLGFFRNADVLNPEIEEL